MGQVTICADGITATADSASEAFDAWAFVKVDRVVHSSDDRGNYKGVPINSALGLRLIQQDVDAGDKSPALSGAIMASMGLDTAAKGEK